MVTVSIVRTSFMVEVMLTLALGPGKFTRFMGIIIGLFHDDGPTTVQGLQAFRSCDLQLPMAVYEAHP